jgi:hypothetical protein
MNGFGHEEWLFNYEWCVGGNKYGFLQPINKHRALLEGRTLAVALYTKAFDKTWLVAAIHTLYVPMQAELDDAFGQMATSGWLDQMREDVAAVKGKLDKLADPDPESIINVRFRPEDVVIYDPMLVFPDEHNVSKMHRYQALLWTDDEASVPATTPSQSLKRSETLRIRAAQDPTTVDPRHVRLQNRLYDALCAKYGKAAVSYEDGCVDLKATTPEGVVFFEIKITTTAKKCIREALGQLVEYAVYPQDNRSIQWVVVGDAPVTGDDLAYLTHLRATYNVPLYYARFNWETGDIERPG